MRGGTQDQGGGARPTLILRFQASMMSFGEYGVGDRRVTRDFPTTSLLTGLIANALGWLRTDSAPHDALQRALMFATRCDRVPVIVHDYQTVDLSRPRMRPALAGWTTRGEVAERTGNFGEATHVRWVDYLSDGAYTLAVAFRPGVAGTPGVDEVASALLRPARPLYLGRRACPPATASLLCDRVDSPSVVLALLEAPRLPQKWRRTGHGRAFRCWWPAEEAPGLEGEPLRVLGDHRDWASRAHVGATVWMHGVLAQDQVRAHFGLPPAEAGTPAGADDDHAE